MERKEVFITHPDFYQRTDIDKEIINKIIEKRTKELGRCDTPKNKENIKVWARAFNNIHRDYCHTLEGIFHFEEINNCVLKYKRGQQND